MPFLPGDTFEVIFRDGESETRGSVLVIADADGRPTVGRVTDVSLTLGERLMMMAATTKGLVDADALVLMTVTAFSALVERARGGGSAEDDEP